MKTEWTKIAHQLGSIAKDGSESGGHKLAQQALDEILGDEWIGNTVEHILSFKPGRELAMNCLCYLHSTKALAYAYGVYQTSTAERAEQAVWLIKNLANPIPFDWVEGFLNDANVIHQGLGVLDQLLWTEQISFDERVDALLDIADKKSNGELKQHIDFIRQYVKDRK